MRTLLGNLFPGTLPGNPLLANLFLEAFFCNLSWKPVPGNLAWQLFLEPLLGNLAWEPVLGNLAWESFLVTLLANLFLENLIGNLVLGVAEDPKLTLLGKNVPKQVPRKRFPSTVKFLGTACKYGSQKRFPSKVPGTVSKQGSKQEQGSQEQVLKQAFPGRAASQTKFPGATGNPCLRTSSWEHCLRTSS